MDNNEYTWVQIAIDIIPSVLGFSLGGMAILLAFSNETFLEGIREGGRPDSLFMDAVVMFFHFILLQVIALLTSFITAAYSCIIISMMGFFLMTYAAMAAVAVAAALFEMSALFNISGNQNSSTNTKDKE